ncbi:sulfite exporter TauE/SafE family protein [Acidovorax sp. SUPP950]|uniref:sulfite exporter TauE/SafE family protein n=1 Tax=unclassified Acidovorax TaxID=2684926 RepID=UPI0023494CD1|nr:MULTISPECIES: sulfite exporter TauE/SafE family protein [unclassified Acidovorax]WCM96700.1 sulfite exporter TauE/SafE family protein [Acidovorax sp. GBBC 1281]GKS74570.1 sulfite exporter TauE/SafE family protein [Acidovorax sp. SUPP950]GKS88188.1 sulfite exporter TauE/SafE family protein [Acidovorax sp. SUPP2539]GKS96874.1 sulfite exporter TauE/SafE family protein [Acidovorax sp. SUPP2825]GKS99449.1 sulfite exporter TauE/SafE family protein [Acidovorax sp. SUPP3434]
METIYWVVGIGAVVAGFVQGLSGFAFGMVAMSFWAWTLEPRLAAALAVFGALTGQIVAAVSVRRGFDVRTLAPFVLGGLLGIPLGVALLPRLDMVWFKTLLGALLVLWCPTMLMAKRLPRIRSGGRVADGVVGLAGGVMGGIGGFTGTLPTLWCTLRGYEKDQQRAVIQNFNLSMLLVTMGTYLGTGMVTRDMLPFFAIVAPAMLVPTLLGTRLYIGLSDVAFRQIVLGLLTASGVALLASSLPQLVARHL